MHNRPDLAYIVSMVSQFMHGPSVRHMQVVDCILRYLKALSGSSPLFKKGGKGGNISMEAYTNDDYAGSVTSRRSTSDYCMLLGGDLVRSRSKKQNVVFNNQFYGFSNQIVRSLKLFFCSGSSKVKCRGRIMCYDLGSL